MTQQQQVYRLEKLEGYEQLKQTTEQVAVPKRGQVLVRLHAVSLNYRDLMVSYGKYGGKIESQVVPCSDGAGEIVQVGEDVTDFQVGDKVCGTFFQKWTDGRIPHDSMNHALGASLNGVLCQYRVFESTGVIKYPSFLSYEEASTLPCAALTAWNALAHNGVQNIGPNQTVLILGTGGVSVFGIQFALAAGARVIVTSSSDEKLQIARSLGVKETDLINYSKNANWDEKVNELTNGRGVDHVVEVGGPGTLPKSLNAVRAGGHVHMIGVLTQQDQSNIAIQVLFKAAILRGVLIGSLGMFTEMNKTIEHNQIRPVIDKVFSFNEAKDAYRHLESQKHVGKVVIRID